VRLVPVGVAVIAATLYLTGLGAAPFVDAPEGFHAEIAREMVRDGHWVTPRLDGVRYFEKPPLLYWILAGLFQLGGVTPFVARLPSALAAAGVAGVTAWIGVLLGGPRLGLLAGLMVAANLGIFVHGRLAKPDLLFILFITLAWAGFAAAYLGRAVRTGLVVFYVAVGLAALAKDILGTLAPLATVAIFFWITRERPLALWRPWWGIAALAVIVLPWYVAVEVADPGFLWYMAIDNHVLGLLRQRVFPDEDVALGSLEFLIVTVVAFLPWSLSAPHAIVRSVRRRWDTAVDRLWGLFALWAVLVVGFFTAAPFKLPHYGLPAFPALALLTARLWEDTLAHRAEGARVHALLLPVLMLFAAAAVVLGVAWVGRLPLPREALQAIDVTARNFAARGQEAAGAPLAVFRPALASAAVILGVAAAGLAVATWRRRADLGVTVVVAAMLAFLPLVGKGAAEFARGRSAAPITAALLARWRPGDVVVHEGALENTASLLLSLPAPIPVVDGRRSNLAFGATFPDSRDRFWDAARLQAEWRKPGRHFLVSVVGPPRSVVATLPPGTVHLIVEAGGRRLYSNLADRAAAGRS
jgi:4-amino-4-deoxy-L-arabinose transferase-like glycosyltransferase